MPIIHTKKGWKFGKKGHLYRTRSGALLQMRAIKFSQSKRK
jgi:hypothetical protein